MRKPKRPHRVLLELSSDESDLSDDSDVVDELENMGGFEPSFMAHDELLKTRRRPIPAAGSKNRVRIHENANDREDRDNSVPEIIQKLGFCCAICTCSISEQEEKLPEGKEGMVHWWVQAEDGGCWHRRCCHGAYTLDETWCPAHDNTLHECLDGTGQKDNANTLEWVTHDEIQRCYNTSKRQEAALYNADGMVHPLELLRTSDDYARIVKGFQAIKKKQKQKYGAVVLEAFAGVGTGTVALKRLGIKIQKVIYVEHDKVSTHVYRSNHDCSYNADLVQSGNIEHVYKYVTFEDLEKDFKQVLKDHGPIDIVLGGPPCIDYSKVNARRQGHMGEQGTYMLRFGQLIRKIEKYQETKYDRPHPLFFLAENVFLSGDDLFAVRDAFQFNFDPVALDAMYLSPCRRNRHYFTNIPLQNLDFTALSSTQGPEKCLEDGYFVPAHIVDAESCAKAQCFMASKTRIDERSSLRMYVFHQSPNKKKQKNKKILQYRGRPMTIVERERMMGYPEGYIEKPVKKLFQILMEKGIEQKNLTPDWREQLPRQYHCFAGNYHSLNCTNAYRFGLENGNPASLLLWEQMGMQLKMAPPMGSSKTPSFFTAEDYSKHLVGLAFSVPVIEKLLEPLKEVFASQYYEGYTECCFAWEDNNGG